MTKDYIKRLVQSSPDGAALSKTFQNFSETWTSEECGELARFIDRDVEATLFYERTYKRRDPARNAIVNRRYAAEFEKRYAEKAKEWDEHQASRAAYQADCVRAEQARFAAERSLSLS